MARIVMLRDERTKEYELSSEAILGRKSTCDIRVPSPKCSREHCRIIKGSNGYFLDDMGSSNGTLVNGEKIGRHLLKNGDEITVGGVVFRFQDKTDDPLVGKRLGKYHIIDKVGVGGMGVVYRASQVTLGREVALKVMSRRLASKQNFIQSFEREAKIAARLQHPNIIGIHDFGHEADWYYFSMEFVEGENLLDMALRQGGLSVDECMEFGAQIAEALDHAHNQGILHKDIKPQNVMIDNDNRVKLADMGLASMTGDESDMSENPEESNSFMATPQYVAPEIIRRLDPDARSDLYSLAATLYHMLTGKPPYQADNVKELLKKHLNAPIPNPKEVREDTPDELAAFIMRGLAKDPAERIQTAREFADTLEEFSKKKAGSKTPTASPKKAIKPTINMPSPAVSSTTRSQSLSGTDAHINAKKMPIQTLAIIGGGALALIILLAVVFSGDPEKESRVLLKQAKDMYVNGADESSKTVLQKILNEYPETTAAEDARKMLEMYRGSPAKQEIYRVKNELSMDKITTKKAANQLKLFLQQGNLSREDEKAIVDMIVSIGEDPDIRSKWEKEIDDLLNAGKYYQALDLASKTVEELDEESEKKRAEQLVSIIESKINSKAKEIYELGTLLRNQDNTPKAIEAWQELLTKYPRSEWASKAAQNISEMKIMALRDYARSWNSLKASLQECKFAEAREEAFQSSRELEKTILPRCGKDIENLMSAFEAFYRKLLEVAKEKTKIESDYVKLMIEGKERSVSLLGENGKLYAVGKANRKEILLKELKPTDIARIMPSRGISEKEALGASLFFGVTGANDLSKDYSNAIINDNVLKDTSQSLELLLSGLAPLTCLDWLIDGKASMEACRILNGRIVFFAQGFYENPEAVCLLDGARIELALSKQGGMEIVSAGNAIFSLLLNEEKLELSAGDSKATVDYPKDGVSIQILTNELVIYNESEELKRIPAEGIGQNWGLIRFISTGSSDISRFAFGISTEAPQEEEAPTEDEPAAEG